MTQDEIKKGLLYEARTMGHAEARTKGKEKAAQSLVDEGKLVRGGGSTGGWSWYKLAGPKVEVPMTLEEKRRVTAEYRGPKAVCACGHLGDGDGKDIAGKKGSHAGLAGHGACKAEGCTCERFTWNRFTEAFQLATGDKQ